MKKIMILCLATMTALASCNKQEQETVQSITAEETVSVDLHFEVPNTKTRSGFFDDVVDYPMQAENKVNSVNIYIYDESGARVYSQWHGIHPNDRTPTGFLKTLELPREACGMRCRFCVYANKSASVSANSPSSAIYESNTNLPHNSSTLPVMLTPEFWENEDFLMSANQYVDVKPYGLKTYVEIPLVRVEAKLAIRLKIADDFAATHNGGMIYLTECRLENLTSKTYLFRDGAYNEWNRALTQQPHLDGGYYRNLFYLYSRSGAASPVNIRISGVYDYDGNPATTSDQTPVEYNLPVSPGGEVDRNTFYRIDGVIKGVGNLNLDIAFTVKEWVVPETQIIEI